MDQSTSVRLHSTTVKSQSEFLVTDFQMLACTDSNMTYRFTPSYICFPFCAGTLSISRFSDPLAESIVHMHCLVHLTWHIVPFSTHGLVCVA